MPDHGELGSIMSADSDECESVLAQFSAAGVELEQLSTQLQVDGAKAFVRSWDELLAVIASTSKGLKGELHAVSVR